MNSRMRRSSALHGGLGHLKDGGAGMGHDFRTDLRQLLAGRG
jgi:hypothetical protein